MDEPIWPHPLRCVALAIGRTEPHDPRNADTTSYGYLEAISKIEIRFKVKEGSRRQPQ